MGTEKTAPKAGGPSWPQWFSIQFFEYDKTEQKNSEPDYLRKNPSDPYHFHP